MNRLICLFGLFFYLSTNTAFANRNISNTASSSEKPAFYYPSGSIDTSAIIKSIRVQFSVINSELPGYKRKRKDMPGFSAEGGVVTGYYKTAELVKANTIFYGETGKVETDYYFNKKGLFFQYKKTTIYDKPVYTKGFKVKNTMEERLYFNENKLIKWVSGKTVKPEIEFNKEFLSAQTAVKDLKKVLAQ